MPYPKYSRASLTGEAIANPVQCLGLAVIQQAIIDYDRKWLRNGDTLEFWCDCAKVTMGAVQKAGEHWCPPFDMT